jgi:hypothetical protein
MECPFKTVPDDKFDSIMPLNTCTDDADEYPSSGVFII